MLISIRENTKNKKARSAWLFVEPTVTSSQMLHSEKQQKMQALFACFSLMEPTVGLEPTTYGLQNRCSTS